MSVDESEVGYGVVHRRTVVGCNYAYNRYIANDIVE